MPHISTATATVSPANPIFKRRRAEIINKAKPVQLLYPYMTAPNIIAAIAIVNVWTFMLFGLDKIRAEEGSWRISESSLLHWSFFGGTLGAYAGRAIFRHKTRKQPFCSNLHGIAIFQSIAGASAGGWFLI